MSSESSDRNPPYQEPDQSLQQEQQKEAPRMADPYDLVYAGGFTGDPQEILGNPAVAPEMLSEGRDLRTDIFREAEAANPDEET